MWIGAPLQPLDFAAAAGWTVEECGYLRRALYFNRYRCGRGCGRATDGALDLGLWLEPCRRYQYTYLGTYGNMRAIIYQYHGPQHHHRLASLAQHAYWYQVRRKT